MLIPHDTSLAYQKNKWSIDNTKNLEISTSLINYCYGLVFLEMENVSDFFSLSLMESKLDDNWRTDYLVDT